MQNPDNLRISRQAENLTFLIYDLSATFPRDERVSFTTQMRRAAISIGSNIFEGCAHQNSKFLIAFLYMANASAYMANASAAELIVQLPVAKRLRYGDQSSTHKPKAS